MRKATVSFCSDLTDPEARAAPLFYLTVVDGHLCVEFAQTHSDMMRLVGRDMITLGVAQMFPWWLAEVFEEAGPRFFFQQLTELLASSSLYVSEVR